jgi:hypothetical protein
LEDSTPAVACKEMWGHYLYGSSQECDQARAMFATIPVSSEWRTIHSRSPLIFTEGGRSAFRRLAGMYHIEQTYCSLDVEVLKSKEPAGIIDQRRLSDKIMSLYNGSGVCFRALS